MTVSQNYVGRNVDLCVLETGAQPGVDQVFVGITGSGSAISGPWKAAQAFFKTLLTSRGSVAADPSYGTFFATNLLGGAINSEMRLRLEFHRDLPDVLNYLSTAFASAPDDERITEVSLEALSVRLDSAVLRIRLTFRNSSTILAPVAISTV
jgi:hypothetical protein